MWAARWLRAIKKEKANLTSDGKTQGTPEDIFNAGGGEGS
jgi:hypothetical protein